jgi:hypothetical protein
MLREIAAVRQDSDKVKRRWFQDDYFDLFVWTDEREGVVRFHMCYDRQGYERVLAWSEHDGFQHYAVHSDEETPVRNDAALFADDGRFEAATVVQQFALGAESLPAAMRAIDAAATCLSRQESH